MQNIKGTKEKKVLLTSDFKTPDTKIKLSSLNNRIKDISFRSSACSLLGYLIITLSIIKIYAMFNGKHPVMLAATLFNLCFAMGILLYLACKVTYKDSKLNFTDDAACLNYQLQRLAGQRKLISLYMLEYTVLVIVSGIFFSGITPGPASLLKVALPVSIITYVPGAYFVFSSLKLTRIIKSLQLAMRRKAPLKYFMQN